MPFRAGAPASPARGTQIQSRCYASPCPYSRASTHSALSTTGPPTVSSSWKPDWLIMCVHAATGAPEIFAIPADEDLREDKKSSQYLPSWDFRLLYGLPGVAGTGPWAVLPAAEPSAPASSSPSLSQSKDMSAPPGKLKSPNRSGSLRPTAQPAWQRLAPRRACAAGPWPGAAPSRLPRAQPLRRLARRWLARPPRAPCSLVGTRPSRLPRPGSRGALLRSFLLRAGNGGRALGGLLE
eukprot:scaffold7262_cov110-Isochrysis_galbana.AAC.1